MAEAEQTKVCPLCAETIKAAARVCPYCRKNQKQWIFLNVNDLFAVASIMFFLASGVLAFMLFQMGHGRLYTPKANQLEIIDSKIALERDRDNGRWTNLVVVGVVSNSTAYSWRIWKMDIRFLNQEKKTMDADDLSFESFVVLPNSDHSFRSEIFNRSVIPDHASYKLRIEGADDPYAWRP